MAPHGSVPGVSYVHFNALRNDEAYRADVLEKALQSSQEEILRLAEEIRALEAGPVGGVKRGPDRSEARGRLADTAGARPVGRRQSGATTAAIVLAALGVVGGAYLANETGLLDRLALVDVEGSLMQDTLWRANKVYRLNGLVFVEGKAILSIEPGTRILGNPGSALIVTRDANIQARGTAEQPIVFTSVAPVGDRARGDWGGLVLLGNAPVNTSAAHVEGIDREDSRGAYGGRDESDGCGILQYVRIEFAGYEISKDNELNGLTLGGCGSGTILRFVQVHMGLDDGIELFGGTANLSNIVITRAADDGLDWDRGWTGSGQFIVIAQDAAKGDSGIEADNLKDDPNATPRSAPTLSNVTILGGGNPAVAQRGITLRRGTGADLRNTLIAGFSLDAIDVRDRATVEQIETGALKADALVFSDAVGGRIFESEEGTGDDDGGFDEAGFFQGAKVRSAVVPSALIPASAYSPTAPDFTPDYNESLTSLVAPIPQGEFWDEAANFVGAIRPGSRTDWLDGWTAFPEH